MGALGAPGSEAISGGWEVCTEGGSFHKHRLTDLGRLTLGSFLPRGISVSPHNLPPHRLPCSSRASESQFRTLVLYLSSAQDEKSPSEQEGIRSGGDGGGGGWAGLALLVFTGSQTLLMEPFQTVTKAWPTASPSSLPAVSFPSGQP